MAPTPRPFRHDLLLARRRRRCHRGRGGAGRWRVGRRRGRRRAHRAHDRGAAGPRRASRAGARGTPRRRRHHGRQHREGQPAAGHPAHADRASALPRGGARLRRGQPGGPGVGGRCLRGRTTSSCSAARPTPTPRPPPASASARRELHARPGGGPAGRLARRARRCPTRTRGAVALPDQLQIDPLDLLRRSPAWSRPTGGRIVEHARVTGVHGREPGDGRDRAR